MRSALAAGLAVCLPLAAPAGPLIAVPYDDIAATTRGRVDFEALPPLPEPGHDLHFGYAFAGGRIGERFAGQALVERAEGGDRFDAIAAGAPDAPLALEPGAPGHGLSVSFHRAFGSNALYPLGPEGWPGPEGRGEGAAAILFDADSCAVALRIHTEYTDALGTRADHRGTVTLAFFARSGQLIGQVALSLPAGISDLGVVRDGRAADIAGVLVTNTDRGGVSLDDIRFGCPLPVG
ncbi:MAG: hypothetical protein ACP5EN_11570 [Rhodovulum sp.]